MPPEPSATSLIDRVRLAWASGASPDLRALIQSACPPGEALSADAVDAIVEDAEQRWNRGLAGMLEAYLAILPEHAADERVARSLLMLECSRRLGDDADRLRAELLGRFPRLGPEIDAVCALQGLLRSGAAADAPEGGAPLKAGAVLGKFQLRQWLGAGSFGEVWCAWDAALERYVALKLLPAERHGSSTLAAVMREAKSASSIDHEHVVKVHDAGRIGRRCYIDTQLVGDPDPTPGDPKRVAVGRPLSAVVGDTEGGRGVPPRQAARVMEAVCHGAAAAHARAIIHRDIKPSNILITPSGRPFLGDFGLSALHLQDDPADSGRAGAPADSPLSMSGRIAGTPAFMAPEQARGEPASPASDVYCLGASLRFALTGKLPFQPSGRHSADDRWDVVEQVRRAELSPLARERPDLPRDLTAICDRAMAALPAQRYLSAQAMGADLSAFLQRRPVSARPAGPARAALLWAKRNPALLSLSAAMVILAGAGLQRYLVAVGRERDRAVAAELASERQLQETKAARATTQQVNEFLQSVLSAAEPQLLGRKATILDAVRLAEREVVPRFREQPLVEADIRFSLGSLYGRLGENDLARTHLDRAIELYILHRGPGAADALDARKTRAMIDWQISPSEEAAAALGRIVEEMRAALGPDDRVTLASSVDLASVHATQHRLDLAMELLVQTQQAYARIGLEDSLEAIQCAQVLASLKQFFNQRDESLALLRDVLARERRLFGPEHYHCRLTQMEIAMGLEPTGRYDEAAAEYLDAYRGLAPQLPAGHEYLLLTARGFAAISSRLDRPQEGLDLLLPVARDFRSRPDRETHQDPATSEVLGVSYWKLGRFAESETELLQALAGHEASTGSSDNAVVRKTRRFLARLYEDWGKPEEALRYRD